MGIIGAAMSGLGYALGAGADVGAAGMMDQYRSQVEQDRQTALMQVKQQIDQQNIQAQESMKVNMADQQRQQLAGRTNPTDNQLDAATTDNYRRFNGPNSDPAVGPGDMVPEELQKFAPSQKQVMGIIAQNAAKSGDWDVAKLATGVADAGKVAVPYGGKVVDQNDIDPDTGEARTVADNSLDRSEIGRTRAGADVTKANAAETRAKSYANRPTGSGAFDKELTSLKNSMKDNVDEQRIINAALVNARPAERPALNAKIARLEAEHDALESQAVKRRAQIATSPSATTGGKTSYPSVADAISQLDN